MSHKAHPGTTPASINPQATPDGVSPPLAEISHDGTEGSLLEQARQIAGSPLWPLAFCISWIATRDRGDAAKLYTEQRMRAYPDKAWANAQEDLMKALVAGDVAAVGVGVAGKSLQGAHTPVTSTDWLSLTLEQRGFFFDVRMDGALAYRDVRIAAKTVMKRWSLAQRYKAKKKELEANCLQELICLMRDKPKHPVSQAKLLERFPGLGEHLFAKIFGEAALTTKSFAWRLGGRRRAVR